MSPRLRLFQALHQPRRNLLDRHRGDIEYRNVETAIQGIGEIGLVSALLK